MLDKAKIEQFLAIRNKFAELKKPTADGPWGRDTSELTNGRGVPISRWGFVNDFREQDLANLEFCRAAHELPIVEMIDELMAENALLREAKPHTASTR